MKNNITHVLILLFLSSFQSEAQQEKKHPNILWIVSEDNSPFIGAYGDEFATTPHIDNLAGRSVLYENAFASAPVCAPARSTLITGVYPTAMGTQHMRSTYPIPAQIRFFPHYLREAGYYTSNNAKKDYNTVDQPEAWDESSKTASYKNRKPGQPFFAVFNIEISHESSLHQPVAQLRHDPEKVPIPPYHPSTPEMKQDLAHYYDKMEDMDARVGEILQELEDSGLAETTIVFYYGDHGGALGRSKRFMYESGLLVPLIIHFPEMYKYLEPAGAGTSTDRIVTFVDFAPTVLSLADLPIPGYMQGYAFLGEQQISPQQYAFGFRGRTGDRTDMVRAVRDKQFRYIRNYMPHKIYGQYIDYLWKAPSMRSWEKAFLEGELDEVQSLFWKTKPVEELFDVKNDPHNINNLALDPAYKKTLNRMRKENRKWMLQVRDVGFIPEAMLLEISKTTTLYEYGRSGNYDLENIIKTAELATKREVKSLSKLIQKLDDPDPVVRYWAATGCTILGEQSKLAADKLVKRTEDPELAVRIAAAEALYRLGQTDIALNTLISALSSDNKMARLQAINVMEVMGEDAASAFSEIDKLISANLEDQNYDILAAKRLAKILKSY